MMLTICSFVLDDGICACILDQLNWQCASRVSSEEVGCYNSKNLQLPVVKRWAVITVRICNSQ